MNMKYLLTFTAAIVCFNAVIMDGECLKHKVQHLKQQYKTEKDKNELPILQDKLANQNSNIQNTSYKPVSSYKNTQVQQVVNDQYNKNTHYIIDETSQNVNVPEVISNKNSKNGAVPPPPPPPPAPPTIPTIPTVKTSNSGVEGMSLEEELAQKMSNLKKTEQNQTLSPDQQMQQEMLAIRAKFNKNKEKKDNIENNNVLKDDKKTATPLYNQQQYKPVKKVIPEKPQITTEEQLATLDNTYNSMMKSMQQLDEIMKFAKSKPTISNTKSMKYQLEQKEQINKLNTVYNSITKSIRNIKETITNIIKSRE